MNAISGTITALVPAHESACLDEAHILRSKLIERCAAVERSVMALLRAYGSEFGSRSMLSSKIEALRKLAHAQSQPRRGDRKLLQLLESLSPLAELRSELAHSTMLRGTIEGKPVIILKNAGENHPIIDRRVLVSISDLKDAIRKLSEIANQLKQLANPASPPPPGPAAAAGP